MARSYVECISAFLSAHVGIGSETTVEQESQQKAETTAASSVTGQVYDLALLGTARFYSNPPGLYTDTVRPFLMRGTKRYNTPREMDDPVHVTLNTFASAMSPVLVSIFQAQTCIGVVRLLVRRSSGAVAL
jgi:hypothetical protein